MSKLFPKSSKITRSMGGFTAWIVNDFASKYTGLVAPKFELGWYKTKEEAKQAINEYMKKDNGGEK